MAEDLDATVSDDGGGDLREVSITASAVTEASLSDVLGAEREAKDELGRYVLLRELGRGAIGVVYAAYHEGLDRRLAIKVLNHRRAGRRDFEARLRREARALAKLSHPNVVQVYDVGEVDGRVFVVMEFVEGITLRQWMRSSRTLDEVIELFGSIGEGLAAAHAAGVVHRDFKPDNVIVGTDGRPRILDFGLARAVSTRSETLESGPEPEGRARAKADSRPSKKATREPASDARDEAGDTFEVTFANLEDPSARSGVGAEDELEPTFAGNDEDELVLTRTGAQVGTPAYMSPEQFLAQPATPASDQFGFCVALHEAVYGCRPYAAKTKSELMVQVHGAAIVDPPAHTKVPKWMRELILRGLSPKMRERWPSMEALIEAMRSHPLEQRRRQQRRRRWIAAGVGAAFCVALGLVVGRPEAPRTCPEIQAIEAELWTPELAGQISQAFLRSKLGYADAAWLVVEDRIEDWASRWAVERRGLCEAVIAGDEAEPGTSEVEVRAGQVLDLRQACLVRARRGFEALVETFVEADATVVERAVEAVAGLPDPAHCGELETLAGELERPPSAVAEEVATIRGELAALDTRRTTGRWRSGIGLALTAVERAERTGYGPLVAEALLVHGQLRGSSGNPSDVDTALDLLQDALDEADRSGHRALAPVAATELVSLSIYAMPDPVRGRLWSRRMHAGLDRLERLRGEVDDELGLARARAAWAQGNLERLDGDSAQAEAELRRALELLEHHAPSHPERGVMLNDLGNALVDRGELEAARVVYEQGLRASVAAFGEGHPRVANAHFSLARVARELGELDQASEHGDQAYVIYVAARGARHRDVGDLEILRSAIALADNDPALGRERAVAAQRIYDAALAEDNIDRAEAFVMLGNASFMLGEHERALGEYRSALDIKAGALPPGHIELVWILTNIGLLHLELGQFDAATRELGRALALMEASPGFDPALLRQGRLYLGDALLSLSLSQRERLDEAIEVLERGADGCEGEGDDELCAFIEAKLDEARARAR